MHFLFSGSLLRYVGYQRQIAYETGSLAAALKALFKDYPALEGLMMETDHSLRRTMRMAINNEVVRSDLSRPLAASDAVEVMTAISGG
ncbi:molybdopterin converting factor small subunit [Silvimonas terrae]|uniref:Molybdopterin converting factor small subunit n=1 Tax=Silvimonas terrae TaxID=300266 RepID=A0A840RED2_9NEIS|nr:MoaD/ThiS family protein [Silvimonas terrae]MBB5190944.1 molybdopterin converting factor small subunit [Silvimonas terrae]